MDEILRSVDYTKQTKLFIISENIDDYVDYCNRNNLDPLLTFWDNNERDADRDIVINLRQGLRVKKILLDRLN